jgi:hypothetical protein
MSKFRSKTYDAAKDSGTSAGVPTDLNPGKAYNVDLRYVRPQERGVVGSASKGAVARVDRFMRSARAAGKYQKNQLINEPTSATAGDSGGRAGSTAYADKPKRSFGRI